MFCFCVIKNDAKKLVESVFIMAQVMSSKSKTDKIAALLINDAYREVIQAGSCRVCYGDHVCEWCRLSNEVVL